MPSDQPSRLTTNKLLTPQLATTPEAAAELQHVPVLLRHSKRPQWGLAIRAWSRDGRQALQFQDGKLRVFPSDAGSLLERVVRPVGETISLSRRLRAMSGVAQAKRRSAGDATPAIQFSEQISLFKEEYPEGFQGEAWKKERHGRVGGSALKRHRDPAIAGVQELLTCERLDGALKGVKAVDMVAATVALLSTTNLVPQGQLAPLKEVTSRTAGDIVDTLRGLLYGHLSLVERMDHFVEAVSIVLDKSPSWCIVTALAALNAPDRFAYIRRTTVVEQAKSLAPGLRLSTSANGPQYEVLVSMTQSAHDRLTAAEFHPRDLIDVYDFMYATLAPAATKRLAKRRAAEEAESTKAAAAAKK